MVEQPSDFSALDGGVNAPLCALVDKVVHVAAVLWVVRILFVSNFRLVRVDQIARVFDHEIVLREQKNYLEKQ